MFRASNQNPQVQEKQIKDQTEAVKHEENKNQHDDQKSNKSRGQAHDSRPNNQGLDHFQHKTTLIELCDHYEYFSDNEGEVGDNKSDDAKKQLDIEIPGDETQGGYASGPENLEHSSIFP